MSTPVPDTDVSDDIVDRERTGTRSHAVLIAVASLAIAWSGFQGSEWARARLDASDESAALREETNQLNARAERLEQQDTVLYVQWLSAVESGDRQTADTLFELFRPELQAYVQSAPTDGSGVPLAAPFDSPDYDATAMGEDARQLETERQQVDEQGGDASRNVARYAGMGVLFAVALVLTGIASRFDGPYRRGLQLVAQMLLVIGLVYLLATPMSFSAP